MSALAHLIEQRGIATTTIGIIRVHMEKVRVPRGLWVPFELGRPLGEPEDAAFQHRVVMAALALLERTDAARRTVRLLGVGAHGLSVDDAGPAAPFPEQLLLE